MTEDQKAKVLAVVEAVVAEAVLAAGTPNVAAIVAAAIAAEQDRILGKLPEILAAEEADLAAKLSAHIKPV